MAFTDDIRRKILTANSIDHSRLGSLNDNDFSDLASRHGGIGNFDGSGNTGLSPEVAAQRAQPAPVGNKGVLQEILRFSIPYLIN